MFTSHGSVSWLASSSSWHCFQVYLKLISHRGALDHILKHPSRIYVDVLALLKCFPSMRHYGRWWWRWLWLCSLMLRSRYRLGYALGRSGVRSPSPRFSLLQNISDRVWGPPTLLTSEYWRLTRWTSGRAFNWRTHFHLWPRLGISGAIPVLPLYAFKAWMYFVVGTNYRALTCWLCVYGNRLRSGWCPDWYIFLYRHFAILSSVWSDLSSAWGGLSSAWGGTSSVWGDLSSVWGGPSSAWGSLSSAWGGLSSVWGGLSSVWGGVSSVLGDLSSVWGGLSVDGRIQQLRVNLDLIIFTICGCCTTTYRMVAWVMRDDFIVFVTEVSWPNLDIIPFFLRDGIERNHANRTFRSLPPCTRELHFGIIHQSVLGSSKWPLPQNSN